MIINTILEKYKIKDITTNLQDGDHNTAVFYFIKDGQEDVFKSRLKKASPCFLFLNKDPGFEISTPHEICSSFYETQTEVCDLLYPFNNELKIIGITGTNGKSTCVHLCSEILNHNNYKAFSVGTLGVMCGDNELIKNPGATTPSFIDLRRIIYKLRDYEFMCLEVSSHALEQNRLKGFDIEVAGWTNLTQDHLDYHGTMKSYFEAKLKIIEKSKSIFIPNAQKNLRAMIEEQDLHVSLSKIRNIEVLNPAFKLSYNLENLSLSIDIVNKATDKELEVPRDISLPKGRYSLVRDEDNFFVVDYAHTPDAIEKLVQETKESLAEYKIITIFGCGGDRDRTKRPLMLDAALKGSDEVIITSDNPRTENPKQIIEDVLNGRKFSQVKSITNRAEAIRAAVKKYQDKTIVLIAGKGHEEYQDIDGVIKYFSDIEEVKKCLKEIKK